MKFLSDEWFSKVDELKQAAGDLDVPAELANTVINIDVTLDEGATKEIHLKGGEFLPGKSESAAANVSLAADLAKKVFLEGDAAAGMQAFMAGELKVEGDVSQLMALQTVQPSDKQKALLTQINEITD